MYSWNQESKDEEQPAMERQLSATSMFEDEILASNDPNQVCNYFFDEKPLTDLATCITHVWILFELSAGLF